MAAVVVGQRWVGQWGAGQHGAEPVLLAAVPEEAGAARPLAGRGEGA